MEKVQRKATVVIHENYCWALASSFLAIFRHALPFNEQPNFMRIWWSLFLVSLVSTSDVDDWVYYEITANHHKKFISQSLRNYMFLDGYGSLGPIYCFLLIILSESQFGEVLWVYAADRV